MHLDELEQTFVIRLWCKDGHKMHYPSWLPSHYFLSSLSYAKVLGDLVTVEGHDPSG